LHELSRQPTSGSADCHCVRLVPGITPECSRHRVCTSPGEHAARTATQTRCLGRTIRPPCRVAPAGIVRPSEGLDVHRAFSWRCTGVAHRSSDCPTHRRLSSEEEAPYPQIVLLSQNNTMGCGFALKHQFLRAKSFPLNLMLTPYRRLLQQLLPSRIVRARSIRTAHRLLQGSSCWPASVLGG
jgi:hypothetical protein